MQRLTSTQQTAGTLTISDRLGRPAKVDGIPAWLSSDDAIVLVTPSEDGMSVVVKAVAEGTAVVTVEADADLGEGVKPIVGTEDFQVLPAEAISVALSFESPTEQP